MRDRIENLIELVSAACMPWIREKEGVIQFVDPLDHEEISAHYGATHAAAALVLYGKIKKSERTLKQGKELLNSVIERWEKSRMLAGFHNDFNNFALCVLDSYTRDYHEKIQEIVLSTTDSNHDTVNWLPMRWYVNKCRYEWTGEQKYKNACERCAEKIKQATYSDGFIDDRLPKGMSFNLQYDVATVAVMQFLRTQGEEIDLGEQMGALLNAVCPDGDINYLGRGTNQVFAWGLWVYLLASSKQKELDRALKYLEDRLPTMLKNHNLMLNDYPGEEKYMWWDYHYCSVYTAHLLLWLVLAWKDAGKAEIEPKLVEDGSSGVHIYKNENAFVATFDGRTEYLAERGPVIAAIWTKKSGVICKGTFGPWKGAFGNDYIQKDITLRNYTGLIKEKTETELNKNKLLSKLFRWIHTKPKHEIKPLFGNIKVDIQTDLLVLRFVSPCKSTFFNIANQNETSVCELFELDKNNELVKVYKTRNQYGWIMIFRDKRNVVKTYALTIKLS